MERRWNNNYFCYETIAIKIREVRTIYRYTCHKTLCTYRSKFTKTKFGTRLHCHLYILFTRKLLLRLKYIADEKVRYQEPGASIFRLDVVRALYVQRDLWHHLYLDSIIAVGTLFHARVPHIYLGSVTLPSRRFNCDICSISWLAHSIEPFFILSYIYLSI